MVNYPPHDLEETARRIFIGETTGTDVELAVHNMLQYRLMQQHYLEQRQIEPSLSQLDAHTSWIKRNSLPYRETFERYKGPIVQQVLATGEVPAIESLPHHMYFLQTF